MIWVENSLTNMGYSNTFLSSDLKPDPKISISYHQHCVYLCINLYRYIFIYIGRDQFLNADQKNYTIVSVL